MATVYSPEVSVGTYNRVRIKCDYSGTSATLTVQFSRTSSWTDTWVDQSATLTFNGQTKNAAYSYYGTVSSSWVDLVVVSGYSISSSGGTYSWTFNNPSGGVLGCSGTLTIPSQGTAPSGGYINGITSAWNSVANEVQVSTTSAGVTNTGGVSLSGLEWNITENPYTSGIARLSIALPSNGAASTLSNSLSTYSGTNINLLPNMMVYCGLYAVNQYGDYRYNAGTIVTVPGPATVSAGTIGPNFVEVAYSTTADGGYYDKTIEYSLDQTNWVHGVTLSGSAATSGSFYVTGLTPLTSYTIYTRVTTTAGSTSNANRIVANTVAMPTIDKFYGSVNSQSKRASLIYGSDNGQSVFILKMYGSDNGLTKRIY